MIPTLESVATFHIWGFPSRVIPVTSILVLQWLPCQALGVVGLALGLVGLVSVYGYWIKV